MPVPIVKTTKLASQNLYPVSKEDILVYVPDSLVIMLFNCENINAKIVDNKLQ